MADLGSGARFGRYRLRGRVAAGGMGEVYKAAAQGFDGVEKIVAIKLIRTALANEPDLVKMFVEEAKLAFLLNHANLVQTFDVGTIDGQYFIAMEFVEGRTLSHLLRACRNALGQLLPHRHALYIAAEACKGLHYAHRAKDSQGRSLGIVHRDVSPSNILVSRDGEVKVSDFGIAWSTMKSHKSELGAIKGKVPYMPPEQVRGDPLDARADVYALGACLYETLCGRPPFVGPAGALIPLVVEGKFPRPREVVAEIPEDLEAIVLRAMARDPEVRFQTAAAMRDELEELALRRSWRLSSTDLATFAEALDATPIERTPEGDAFDLALGQELCKVADANGELSVFTSALASPEAAAAAAGDAGGTASTTPDVPIPISVALAPDVRARASDPGAPRPSVPGSMPRPSVPPATRAVSSPPAAALPGPVPGTFQAIETASSYTSDLDARPRRRGRVALLYGIAVVAVAVAAGLAARSSGGSSSPGPGGPSLVAPVVGASAPAAVRAPPAASAGPSGEEAPPGVTAVALPVGVAPPGPAPTPPPATPVAVPPVAPTGAPDEPAPSPAPDDTLAVLAINTEPWTNVEIDGARAGTTPVLGRRVRPGRHQVRLTNAARGITRTLSITLRAGERRRIVLDLSAGDGRP